MAFVDENGRITMDEDAANADIANINAAQEVISDSRRLLQILSSEASGYSGNTALAITGKADELLAELNRLDQNLTDTAQYIHKVVEIYRQKDLELKAMMGSGN